jgi:hypothetical protein
MNLFNISKEYFDIINELEELEGELTPDLEERLSITEDQLEGKCIDYGWAIKFVSAEVDTITNEIKRLQERKKAKEKTVERLKTNVTGAMRIFEKHKIDSPLISLSLRKSEAVEIQDENVIPKEYVVEKVTYSPDKTAIKKAIKSGIEVEGAVIVENQNLQIK